MGESYRDRVFKNRKRHNNRKFSLSKFFKLSSHSFVKKSDKISLKKVKANNNKSDVKKVKDNNNKSDVKKVQINNNNKSNVKKVQVNNNNKSDVKKIQINNKSDVKKVQDNNNKSNEKKVQVKNENINNEKILQEFNDIINKSKEITSSRKKDNKVFKFFNNTKLVIASICFLFVIVVVSIVIVNNPFKDKGKIENADNKDVNANGNIKDNDVEENFYSDIPIYSSGETDIIFLGDIMMGGTIGKKLDYFYGDAFKNIRDYTRNADLTFANLTTLITTLDEIDNPKSEYIVKEEIVNGLSSLGVDIVNLASLHMTDFSKLIFYNTIGILKKNDFGITGLEDNIYYTTSNDKKISIISFNSSYNGIKDTYSEYGINVYDKEKFLRDIDTAKSNSDFIIAAINWGRENRFELTEEVKDIAKIAIDNGCNLVVGMNSWGRYPIVEYKNVPIIYSLGEFISDDKLKNNKPSFINKVYISKDNKVNKIEMLPIYAFKDVSIKALFEYSKSLNSSTLNQMNNLNKQNNLNSKIEDNMIIVDFN